MTTGARHAKLIYEAYVEGLYDHLSSRYKQLANEKFAEELQEFDDMQRLGQHWKSYTLVGDEIEIKRVDPTLAYWPANERRYAVVKGRRVGQSFNVQLLREAITRADPPRPWIALPQLERRTPSYLAVQLLLDTYVN